MVCYYYPYSSKIKQNEKDLIVISAYIQHGDV